MVKTLGASDELKSLLIEITKNQADIDAHKNVKIKVQRQ